jgi:DNA primase
MSSSVEKIKERLSIVDVLSPYIKLEKAGASYKAKCPFHNEKSPSFFVSPDRGTYYCFGCGAKGDMFTFVEEFEGLEFRQALKNLAEKAGVELVPEKPGEKNDKDRLFHAVESAVEFFESELYKNKPVLDYLHKRGLTDETIKKWQIGYVPAEWRAMSDFLKTKKISEADMLATGLIKKSEDGTKMYDVFRGRIMFPIFDANGRPVAFSGRIFVDDGKSPKYLNSPATALFNKSEVLYGFDRAKSVIRRLNYAILVEGQMDLILSHQAGLANTVASSGTALTEMHLRRLLRLSPRIMFAFDSDSAGFNATKKSAELALRIGMEVKVAVLPAGDDPASLVAKNPELWKQALKAGKHIIDFYADSLIAKNSDRRVLAREIKASVLPFVLEVESSTEQAHFVKSLAEKAGLKEDAVWTDLKALQKSRTTIGQAVTGGNSGAGAGGSFGANEGASDKKFPVALASRRQAIERRIIGVMVWQESKKNNAAAEAVRKRFVEIAGEEGAAMLEAAVAEEKDKLIFEAEQYYEQSPKFENDLKELFINLEEEMLKDELGSRMLELHRAEVEQNSEKIKEILTDCNRITLKLAELKKKQ